MSELWFMLEGVENGGWIVRVGTLRARYFKTLGAALNFMAATAGIKWEDLKK